MWLAAQTTHSLARKLDLLPQRRLAPRLHDLRKPPGASAAGTIEHAAAVGRGALGRPLRGARDRHRGLPVAAGRQRRRHGMRRCLHRRPAPDRTGPGRVARGVPPAPRGSWQVARMAFAHHAGAGRDLPGCRVALRRSGDHRSRARRRPRPGAPRRSRRAGAGGGASGVHRLPRRAARPPMRCRCWRRLHG